MKVYILAFIFILAIASASAFAPVWVLSLLGCILAGIILFLVWRNDKETIASAKKQETRLIEAGNAITDTLRVAFDNLKKISNTGSKTQTKINDHEARIRRLEQQLQRAGKVVKHQKPSAEPNEPEETKRPDKKDRKEDEQGN